MANMKSVLRFTIAVLFINLFASCGDNLPSPTQDGANTFGCKINGKAWIPNGGGSFSGIKPISAGYLVLPTHKFQLGIYLSAHSRDKQAIYITLNDIKVGTYQLRKLVTLNGSDQARSHADYNDRRGETYLDEIYYATNDHYGGEVIITRSDSTAKVISGRFNFTAVDSEGKTAVISDGRFDVKYPL